MRLSNVKAFRHHHAVIAFPKAMTTTHPYLSVAANIGRQILRAENHAGLNTTSYFPGNLFIRPAPTSYRTSFSSRFLILLLLCFITLAHTLDLHYKTLQAPRLIDNPGQQRTPLPDQVLFSVLLPPPCPKNSGGIMIYLAVELPEPGGEPLRHALPSP